MSHSFNFTGALVCSLLRGRGRDGELPSADRPSQGAPRGARAHPHPPLTAWAAAAATRPLWEGPRWGRTRGGAGADDGATADLMSSQPP
ncbi:hypothetical protein CEXT_529091 [Caerostris extrusa]|uniref:Uncharacterized protein n=1 Tax=Caerostris extrusa TaxID=172846 RepID=A0AAV4PI07_CAEEX|nr:hypothetical protein CEXT_529091 [Caerostris extrusa]